MKRFFKVLRNYYKDCTIIYKGHPNNKTLMTGAEDAGLEIYGGELVSQLHLNLNINRIKACYSPVSTSLIYSASVGIPSYSLFKYLEAKNKYPGAFFEEGEAAENPYLHNITSINEIGTNDDIKVRPMTFNDSKVWNSLFSNEARKI